MSPADATALEAIVSMHVKHDDERFARVHEDLEKLNGRLDRMGVRFDTSIGEVNTTLRVMTDGNQASLRRIHERIDEASKEQAGSWLRVLLGLSGGLLAIVFSLVAFIWVSGARVPL